MEPRSRTNCRGCGVRVRVAPTTIKSDQSRSEQIRVDEDLLSLIIFAFLYRDEGFRTVKLTLNVVFFLHLAILSHITTVTLSQITRLPISIAFGLFTHGSLIVAADIIHACIALPYSFLFIYFFLPSCCSSVPLQHSYRAATAWERGSLGLFLDRTLHSAIAFPSHPSNKSASNPRTKDQGT
jgi:hypothetical protein